jgi:hypothetical protein
MHELVQEMRKDVSARMKERVDLVSGLLKKDEEGREKVATEKEVVGSNIISIRNAE